MTTATAQSIHSRYETGGEYDAAAKTIAAAVAAAVAELAKAGVDAARAREVVAMICGRHCFEVHKRMTVEDDIELATDPPPALEG